MLKKFNLQKMAKIAVLGEYVYHAKDLANLWQIKNPHTCNVTISRYVKKGLLFRIYKGFYSIKPIDQLDPLVVGSKAIHEYCYLSAENILAKEGIIQQAADKITFISRRPKKFTIGDYHYIVRQMQDKFLFNPAGIIDKGNFKIASVNRAIADILYFNPRYYFDAKDLINWKEVRKIQKEVGFI